MKLQYVCINHLDDTQSVREDVVDVATFEEALIKQFLIDGHTPSNDEVEELRSTWRECEGHYIDDTTEEITQYFFKVE